MDKTIGIVTFHRVYNYGAVIQAYSIQKIIQSYGYGSEIIDFSKKKQIDYTNVISMRNGFKRFIKTLMFIPVYRERNVRKQRFDDFIQNQMILSSKTIYSDKAMNSVDSIYDIYLCGSDQIWNPLKKSDFSLVYMLGFTSKRKLAYAPSIGTATVEDLQEYRDYLKSFEALSCREEGGAAIVREVTDCDVKVVLDPTLLVDKSELVRLTTQINAKSYILYYSLDGYENRNRNMDILKKLSKKFGLEIKLITPEWPFHSNVGEDIVDAGPEEFLSLIRNAALVCTNSFHGTALSIKFERPFYVLEDPGIKDERKRSILKQLGLLERIVSDSKQVEGIDDYSLDYTNILIKLEELRNESEKYLLEALNG